MEADAMEDVVDTSDVEEKEIMEAQKPGYYDKVWGMPEFFGGQNVDKEINDSPIACKTVLFARLQPRTPTPRKLQHAMNFDPSPILSHLKMSLDSQWSDIPSKTLTSTPFLSVSHLGPPTIWRPPESLMSTSSPDLGGFESENSQPSSKLTNGDLVDAFALTNALDSPKDPICLLSPIAAGRSFEKIRISRNINNTPDSISLGNMSETDAKEMAQNVGPNLSRTGFRTPPLEFPASPPQSTHLSPPDTLPGSDPLLVIKREKSGVQRGTVCSPSEEALAVNLHDAEYKDGSSVRHPDPLPLRDVTTSGSPGYSSIFESTPCARPELLFSDIRNPERQPGPMDLQKDLFRSMSPLTPSPPMQPPSAGSTSNLPPPRSPSPIVIPPDHEPQLRKYSLRHRSAKQLNPFEYDKRQYKRQLRGMPEAIVKDPNLGGGRAGRKERYHEGESWEQGEGDTDAEGDGDVEWRAREKRKERQLQREALEKTMRELGMYFESSEEDDVLIEIGRANSQQVEGGNMQGKKRKRGLRVQEFPMVAELENPQTSTSVRQPTPPAHPSPKPRPQPRPNYHGHSQTSPQSVRAASVVTLDAQMDVDRGFGDDIGDSMADDPWLNQEDGSNLPMERDVDGRSSAIPVYSSEDEVTPSSRNGRPKRHTLDGVASDVQILENDAGGPESASSDEASGESLGSEDDELTGKARKQLKALSRMMPGVLRNKLLAKSENQQKAKAKERPSRQDSDHEAIPLQPGRGRKRIVSPSSRDPKRYEIKGDTESESSSSDSVRIADREVIVLDGDEEGEEDAERALDVSEDGLDAEDIQTWLAPELQDEEVSHETTRRRRPEAERDRPRGGDLIDRMLQRTKRVVPQRPQVTSQRQPRIRGPRKPVIDVVTREASRLGAGGGRQTKLAFPTLEGRGRLSSKNCQELSADVVGPSKQGDQDHRVNAQYDKSKSKKSKKKNRSQVQSKLFILQGDGYKVTTGRSRQIIHIDDDDDAFHEALAPAESISDIHARPQQKAKVRRLRPDDLHDKFRRGTGMEPDAFEVDINGSSSRQSKISLDFDLVSLPSGLTLGPDTYIGKGRLYEFISILKGDKEPPSPFSVTLFELQIDPDMPITQISPTIAAACDRLYNASTMAADDNEIPMTVKAADALMYALCQIVTFRALHTSEEEEGLLVAVVSEQINHLVARIDDRVEIISADGHSMDYRSLTLYWFAVEMHLRLVYAHQKRFRQTDGVIFSTSHVAEQYCVQLLRRLLEYGIGRTIGLLQNGRLQDTTLPYLRALELWICIFHVAPFLSSLPMSGASKPTPFWRVVEAAMDAQSNKPDSQLYESERIWRTMFSLCAVSQFSLEGLSTSAARLEAHWPIVKKALKFICLSADVRDNSKPASTLHKRDTYLRLVTARCFLLCTRWKWRLNDADDMFQELCAIFRSRQFSNLLGEPDDFPAFIREGYETFLDVHQKNDTAFGLFLKLIVQAAKDFLKVDDPSRLRGKLVRLLSLAVPVGSTAFTKKAPPTGQGLSMLYNRYSAIFVAVYVDSSATNIRSRLQQVRRYISFKDADSDSRTAAIRSMMHLAILLRHLNKPLDDVLSWASEMIDDLTSELARDQARDGDPAQHGRNELLVLVQLLLGSIRIITNTPTLNHPGDLPAKYPDIGLLQAWMSRIISNPLAKDHRTGLEICKCIRSFLLARQAILPLPSISKLAAGQCDNQESQDEYGDGGLDLNDPALLAFLDNIEDRPDENGIADQIASDILDAFSQPLYTCVCMHLGCTWTTVGGRYSEADQWLECWLGCGDVLVRNKKRVWSYYFQLGESAWKDISDLFRRIHLRLQFMLTVLRLDPNIYKSHENQILALWFECIVSPDLTIEPDFTARLFSIDGLRHAVFQNIPCVADMETGFFAFNMDEFKRLRLPFIEVVLSNVSTTLNSGIGLYIPWVETLLGTAQKWIEVLNRDVVKRVKYVEFVRKVILAIRNHDALTRHPSLQNLLNWGGSL